MGVLQPQLRGAQVRRQVLAARGRRNHGEARLDRPGQHDLGRRGIAFPCDRLDFRLLQHLAVAQRHVRGDVDALAAREIHHRPVLQVGVQFDLVRGDRLRAHGGHGLAHEWHREVRHADAPCKPAGLCIGERLQAFGQRRGAAGRGPVDQRQIDVVRAQLFQALLQAGNEPAGGEVVGPDLGGEVKVAPGHAAGGHRLAHLGLVAVDLRGVHMAVAEVEGIRHRIDGGLALEPERAQAERWHGGLGGEGSRCLHGNSCRWMGGWVEKAVRADRRRASVARGSRTAPVHGGPTAGIEHTADLGKRQRAQHHHRADPGRVHETQVRHDQPPGPRRAGNAEVERGDVQARGHIHGLRRDALGLAHHVQLQARHVAEGHRAPKQHGRHGQPGMRRGELQEQQHDGQQREDDAQRGDRPQAVGQPAPPEIARGHRDTVHQHHPAHRAFAEARHTGEDGRQEGERDEGAAVADGRLGIDQQQPRLGQHAGLLQERGRRHVRDAPRHEQCAAREGQHAQPRHGEEGLAPAEVLADEGAQRHAGDQCHREPREQRGDGAGGLLARHQAGGDGRADREEHAVREAGEHARGHQRAVARCLPGQQIAGGEQRHERQQQGLARQPAGECGEHRRADGHAQRVQADEQAGRGQADAEVRRHGGQQTDDDEFRRADGKRTERQREQGNGHGKHSLGSRIDARSVGALPLRKKPVIGRIYLPHSQQTTP